MGSAGQQAPPASERETGERGNWVLRRRFLAAGGPATSSVFTMLLYSSRRTQRYPNIDLYQGLAGVVVSAMAGGHVMAELRQMQGIERSPR
jgi:hypothetical protein